MDTLEVWMELRHLRYFLAVAEQLNLTRAAEKLFIAQPPLSRAIKQLEEEIGVQLFIRKPRGLELTTGGRYFLEQARQILNKVTTTIEDTRRIAQHSKTVFSIGFVPSVFYGQLPSMVRRLRRNKNLEIILHELKTREQVDGIAVRRAYDRRSSCGQPVDPAPALNERALRVANDCLSIWPRSQLCGPDSGSFPSSRIRHQRHSAGQ